MSEKKLLEIKDVSYKYKIFGKNVLENVDLTIESNEIVGIVGKNGSGKSTLLSLMASLLVPKTGNIELLGINSKKSRQRKNYLVNLQYIAQDLKLDDRYTVKEYYDLFSCLYPNYDKKIEKELIKRFEIEESAFIDDFNLDQRMLVHFVFSIATNASLIILDEVTILKTLNINKILLEFKELGRTFVVATEFAEELVGLADKIYCFKDKSFIRA